MSDRYPIAQGTKHPCRFIVRRVDEGDPLVPDGNVATFLRRSKDGEPYYWRISVCELCGTWYSEGRLEPFPASPAIGEPLRAEEPAQVALELGS